MADDDNDVQMATATESSNTIKSESTPNTNSENIDNKNVTENKSAESTQPPNDQNNDQNNDNSNDKKEDEEKKEVKLNELNGSMYGINPLMLVQSAMNDFLNEMNTADTKATTLYHTHIEKQQRLMNQFVADSLRLMHEFNMGLSPIHNVLKKLKSPLQDVLLS